MKSRSSIRLAVFVFMLIVFLGATSVPAGVAVASSQGRHPYVGLTVINNSQFDFSIQLYGAENYSMTVPAKSREVIIVTRGWYSFTMNACKISEVGTINLNLYQVIHVPVCGGRALAPYYKPHHVDTADYIKPIKIKIRNRTEEVIDLYLRTLDNDYFIHFEPGEIKTQIVLKSGDQYVYSFVACDALQSGYYTARVVPPLDLECASE